MATEAVHKLIRRMRACNLSLEDADQLERILLAADDPCVHKREPTEPMFVLLGRDSVGPEILLEWCRLRSKEIRQGTRSNTVEEREHVEVVMRKVAEFAMWHTLNRALPVQED